MLLLLIFQLIIALFFIRFHADFYRLYRNPIAAKLIDITDPIVVPLRRLIIKTPLKKLPFDPSALLIAWLLSILIGLVFAHGGILIALIFGTLTLFIGTWLNVIIYSIFLTAIASWLQTPPQQPVLQLARACSGMLLAPLRRFIPPLGMFDITPVIALFLLFFIKDTALPALLQSILNVLASSSLSA